jgi:HlyD family secretion protein
MNDTVKDKPALTREALAAGAAAPRSKLFVTIAIALLLAAAAGGYYVWRSSSSGEQAQYRTEAVTRGNLVVLVAATGSLQPTNKVDIGSELSGIVEAVMVDDNDVVKQGQVLARLDLSKLEDQVARSRSSLVSTEAKVRQTVATVTEARANLERLRQVHELSGGKVPSQSEMATAEAALTRAVAEEASARASVTEAGASLRSDETNVRKASIRSPINGVVLSRKVEPGQTVAASLQAPILFTLAENLKQMELQVDVDEADVGRVQRDQQAVFTVDAYPGRRYPARVMRVGFGSQIKDNVVTYPTLLTVNNDDLSLRPGMTATAEITAVTRDDVLLVPNAALRFTPATGEAPSAQSSGGGLVSKLIPRRPRGAPKRVRTTNNQGAEQRVYVLEAGQPVETPVTAGVSDGRFTEVTGGSLAAGAEVITEAVQAAGK